jgi:hypothetical protein
LDQRIFEMDKTKIRKHVPTERPAAQDRVERPQFTNWAQKFREEQAQRPSAQEQWRQLWKQDS